MTSIIDSEQDRNGTTAPAESPSPAPERSRRALGWAAVAVAIVATVTLAVAVIATNGSSAGSDPVPATSVATPGGPVGERGTPDMVERAAASRRRTMLAACRSGRISEISGQECPVGTAPGFRPDRQGGQPRNAR